MHEDAIGIVMAGGSSRRMRLAGPEAGTGKAGLSFRGRSLLHCVCEAVRLEVQEVTVVAAASQPLPVPAGQYRVVRDSLPGSGPLAGIRDALQAAADRARAAGRSPPQMAFVASCDVPLLRAEVVRMLLGSAAQAGCLWAVPLVRGHRQVLVSAMRMAILPRIEDHLAAGHRDPQGLLDRLRAADPAAIRIVTEAELAAVDPDLESFRDIDTPEDMDFLQRR
jgi:molybdopterin-guanine dinucleotide biosynthesis protein A